jgi:diaminopimelate decarboxylase
MIEITWRFLEGLSKDYGDFFYLLDLERFKKNYAEFLGAFRAIYPNTNLAYSYKTNYTPRLCKIVDLLEGYAEVVSRMEYDLALQIGVSPPKIIFNGPVKFEEDIKTALLNGSIVNLDSPSEILMIEALAYRLPTTSFQVGIRCNFDVGTGTVSRFGFDSEGKQLASAFNALRGIENCDIIGLHCHFSAPQRSVESYAVRTRKMLDLCAKYFKGNSPRFIDLGGGFCGKIGEELRKQLDYNCPGYQEYAEVIAGKFSKEYQGCSGPELILEPGIAIAGDVMRFVCKIVGTKTVRSKNFAQATGSIYNIKPTLHTKNLPVKIYCREGGGKVSSEYDIVGSTCMEADYLYRGFKGSISSGDYAVFENVGAYTNVLTPPFIRPAPAMVAVDSVSGECELIRSQERLDNVFATYSMK